MLSQTVQYRNRAVQGKLERCEHAGEHRGDFSGGHTCTWGGMTRDVENLCITFDSTVMLQHCWSWLLVLKHEHSCSSLFDGDDWAKRGGWFFFFLHLLPALLLMQAALLISPSTDWGLWQLPSVLWLLSVRVQVKSAHPQSSSSLHVKIYLSRIILDEH